MARTTETWWVDALRDRQPVTLLGSQTPPATATGTHAGETWLCEVDAATGRLNLVRARVTDKKAK